MHSYSSRSHRRLIKEESLVFRRTPVHVAAQHASTTCLSLLCSRPTFPALYVAERDNAGRTPLHLACGSISRRTPDIVRTLVSISMSLVNMEDNEGKTPLHRVCDTAGDEVAREVVAELLAADADATKEDKKGRMPMDYATVHAGKTTMKRVDEGEVSFWAQGLRHINTSKCTLRKQTRIS